VTGGACGYGARPDRGSGVVLALGLIAVTVSLSLGVIAWGGAALARHQAEAAADLAALAASTGSTGSTGSTEFGPVDCVRAARVAAANGSDLAGCRPNADGSVTVQVTVAVAGLGLAATAAARAGQPP
jgi:secretion/DNA translocation related TadE-like protein